jgi:3-oxoacyl-[acyl-carrier protein] reductase
VPTLTDTDMARDLERFRWAVPMSPQRVAEIFMQGLERDRAEIIVGWQSHLAIWGYRLLPRSIEKIVELAAPKFRLGNLAPAPLPECGTMAEIR